MTQPTEGYEPDVNTRTEAPLDPAAESETVPGAEEAQPQRNAQPEDDPALANPEP